MWILFEVCKHYCECIQLHTMFDVDDIVHDYEAWKCGVVGNESKFCQFRENCYLKLHPNV